MDPYLSMIIPYGVSWAVRDWSLCEGQILTIQSNTALFALLGCTYGGDCQNTFGLPDLRYRFPIHWGTGPGLSHYPLGAMGGSDQSDMSMQEMPVHTHVAVSTLNSGEVDLNLTVSDAPTATGFADGAYLTTVGGNFYTSQAPAASGAPRMASSQRVVDGMVVTPTVGTTGSGDPFPIMSPYLAITYQISMAGAFPSRN